MMLIDPHAHMISRTTDDYQAMADAGVVALIEPAFWVGQPRTYVGTYVDYLSSIVGWERFRAQMFGIRHYCTMGLNPKEANDERVNDEVLGLVREYARKDGVIAIGEIDGTPYLVMEYIDGPGLAAVLCAARAGPRDRDEAALLVERLEFPLDHGLD